MPQTNLRLTATADTTDAKRKLDDLKSQSIDLSEEIANKNRERLKEAVGLVAPVAIGVQALMRVVDAAITKVQEFIARVAAFRETYAKTGQELDSLAKNLNATTAETIRLQAAANAAGVSARDYAAALDAIKSGKTTLADQAAQWERIASSADLAQSRSALFASHIANAQKAREQAIGLAEQSAATIAGLGVHGSIAASFLDEILAGRTAPVTMRDYTARATQSGIGLQSLGVDAASIRTALDALNAMIREQAAAAQAREEAQAKARDARATAVFQQVERILGANGGALDDALARAARLQGLTLDETRASYERGYALLSPEERELRAIREQAAQDAERDRAQAAQDALGYFTGRFGSNAAQADEGLQTVSAQAAALRWALTEGGGLLAGVNYGFGLAQADPAKQVTDAIKDGTKTLAKTLTSIDKTLKDD